MNIVSEQNNSKKYHIFIYFLMYIYVIPRITFAEILNLVLNNF